MSKIRKALRSKLRSAFWKSGSRSRKLMDERSGGCSGSSFPSKLSVNEEYLEVFRTKSYLEMWDKGHESVQHQPSTLSTSTTALIPSSSITNRPSCSSTMRLSCSSPSIPFYTNLSEHLLDPRQETLNDLIHDEGINVHHLLTEYFEASLEACHICEILLRSIHQTRSEYRKIKKLMVKLRQKKMDYSDEKCPSIFADLAAFASQKNPLSVISPVQFRDIHVRYLALLDNLTSRQKKIQRRAKRKRFFKKAGGVGLVVSHSALLIVLLVLAFHSMIGVVAAPAIMAFSLGMCKKKMESAEDWLKRSFDEQISQGEQLDVAARGIYILINDFDTMSRMVKRLQDEVERRKDVAEMCVRTGVNSEIFKEVVREFHVHDSTFMEQIEEIEEHVYLCLVTINRSRKLVLQEILATR